MGVGAVRALVTWGWPPHNNGLPSMVRNTNPAGMVGQSSPCLCVPYVSFGQDHSYATREGVGCMALLSIRVGWIG